MVRNLSPWVEDPIEADHWIFRAESMFAVLNCDEEENLNFITSILQDDTMKWWSKKKEKKKDSSHT